MQLERPALDSGVTGRRRDRVGVYVPPVLRRWLLVCSGSTGLLSCTACGGSGKTVVPDLHGKTFFQATKALADRGLCAPRTWTLTADAVPGSATVVAQDPGPGARVDRGTHVALTLRGRASGLGEGEIDTWAVCSRHPAP